MNANRRTMDAPDSLAVRVAISQAASRFDSRRLASMRGSIESVRLTGPEARAVGELVDRLGSVG